MDESRDDISAQGNAATGRQNLGSLRDTLADLEANGELRRISKPIDIRHIASLVAQSETALLFTNVLGYDIPVVSGIMNSRERLGIAMGCDFSEIEALLRQGLDRPIAPVTVDAGAPDAQELPDSRLDALLGRAFVLERLDARFREVVEADQSVLDVLDVVDTAAEVGARDLVAIDSDQESLLCRHGSLHSWLGSWYRTNSWER